MNDQEKIHNLCFSENLNQRIFALEQLKNLFSFLPDKQQAWNDLHKLTYDEESFVRYSAASVLVSAFSQIPDKHQAWNDLHRLTKDSNFILSSQAIYGLGFVFSQAPDKHQALNDLHELTYNKESFLRSKAVHALDSAFSQIPDKLQAWSDLHRLTYDDSYIVRKSVAKCIGSAFSQIPDKQDAWNDLHRLTNDDDWTVKIASNHSLGRVSIYKASQANKEEDYKEELEKAIRFFEIATKESLYRWDNPSEFCLPFYRSFHIIIFKKQVTTQEIDRYIEQAKYATWGSKNKELLLEAIEQLANALKEVQNLVNLNLNVKKSELNFYRKYCEQASELMKNTKETAPYAIAAMRKGLPILDRYLKGLLEEVQDKAKIACQESQGTSTQEIACTVNREVQKWEIGSQEEMTFNIENLIFTLETITPQTPESQVILNRIKQIPEQKDVAKQYGMLSSIFTIIIKSSREQKEKEIRKIVDQFDEKLEEIKISLKPGVHADLILHLGPMTSYGGLEYVLTIPLQEPSYSEIKDEVSEISDRRISQLSMLPKKTAKIVEDYLVKNKMENLLQKLR